MSNQRFRGVDLIAQERKRQIHELGYDREGDLHRTQQLLEIAANKLIQVMQSTSPFNAGVSPTSHPPHELEKIGALIAAALDTYLDMDAFDDRSPCAYRDVHNPHVWTITNRVTNPDSQMANTTVMRMRCEGIEYTQLLMKRCNSAGCTHYPGYQDSGSTDWCECCYFDDVPLFKCDGVRE